MFRFRFNNPLVDAKNDGGSEGVDVAGYLVVFVVEIVVAASGCSIGSKSTGAAADGEGIPSLIMAVVVFVVDEMFEKSSLEEAA